MRLAAPSITLLGFGSGRGFAPYFSLSFDFSESLYFTWWSVSGFRLLMPSPMESNGRFRSMFIWWVGWYVSSFHGFSKSIFVSLKRFGSMVLVSYLFKSVRFLALGLLYGIWALLLVSMSVLRTGFRF